MQTRTSLHNVGATLLVGRVCHFYLKASLGATSNGHPASFPRQRTQDSCVLATYAGASEASGSGTYNVADSPRMALASAWARAMSTS